MLKNALLHFAGIADTVSCFDCGKTDNPNSFEPCFRLDTQTGDTMHVMICAECIEDIERVYESRLLDAVGSYASKLRRQPDYQLALVNDYASVVWMHTARQDALPVLTSSIEHARSMT